MLGWCVHIVNYLYRYYEFLLVVFQDSFKRNPLKLARYYNVWLLIEVVEIWKKHCTVMLLPDARYRYFISRIGILLSQSNLGCSLPDLRHVRYETSLSHFLLKIIDIQMSDRSFKGHCVIY